MKEPLTLYGFPGSLFTGKVRSYLIKRGIPFNELSPDSERYRKTILPQIKRWIIPVIEMPDGEVVQDGAEIIDFFERHNEVANAATPETPVHNAVSHLFELFGTEGLMRPAMHYRWNFDDTNLAFLRNDFIAGLAPSKPKAEWDSVFQFLSGRMRKATHLFGVTEDAKDYVERTYMEFLTLFDAHLEHSPYLLGGRPTRGDYGLIAPLFAHLGRDPHPLTLMKQKAPFVFRWVERMNLPGHAASQYPDFSPELFENDSVPATLNALMNYFARHYLPELQAHTDFTNDWLQKNPDIKAGTNGLEDATERGLGRANFAIDGVAMRSLVMPYRSWLVQRTQAAAEGNSKVSEAFAKAGLAQLLELTTLRPVLRQDHLEVWGELHAS